ncbi:SMP-30/Gluconolaconase/LRE-like region [Aspergillus luchuensis IFO 4308]|nr:SMP-30/Gluconolaconase/LRE-like region [Aspergillus luchuensis IFO 4308]
MTNSEITGFQSHHKDFDAITGPTPTLELLAEHRDYPFAHEAGIYIPETNNLWITSNRCVDPNGSKSEQKVYITRVDLNTNPITYEEIPTEIPMGNGGINYGRDHILICGDFFGRPFNSVNDVVVHTDGSIWFTDPIYGYRHEYRPEPCLPCQVYRWCPREGTTRAMADGFGMPNGICFSPDEKTVYITDTDRLHGDGTVFDHRVSSIYAFDVSTIHGQPFLTNRRLFAMADHGIPDGIKCDLNGNVYSGCGDGIHVWSPGGVLLGRILIDGGVANFCFGRNGEIFALNEHRLWRVQLGVGVKGALLGL